jgi:hypothetical protein
MQRSEWGRRLAAIPQLATTAGIQAFLDDMPYNPGTTERSPARVLAERTANCMEGALFAAACLERIGYPPRLLDIVAVRDDDHVLAVFGRGGYYGAIAKSNYTGLRYRNPVYRSVRELVLSYFEDYFNQDGELTMRAYTRPLDLRLARFRGWQWAEDIDYLSDALDAQPQTGVLPPQGEAVLRWTDERLLRAGLLGADPAGLFVTKA